MSWAETLSAKMFVAVTVWLEIDTPSMLAPAPVAVVNLIVSVTILWDEMLSAKRFAVATVDAEMAIVDKRLLMLRTLKDALSINMVDP